MNLEAVLLRIPAILVALTVHEYAHGWIALRWGDTTARDHGRLTLNPFPHLDPFGTLMLLFGPFGWAKPVPVQPAHFENARKGTVLVSLAGPASNVVCALVAALVFRVLFSGGTPEWTAESVNVPMMLLMLIEINLGISFFNLLPIPPLDGSKVVMGMLKPHQLSSYLRFARYLPIVFVVLIVAEFYLKIPTISLILNPLYRPYRAFWLSLTLGG
jgi:Zn-dependent protease